MKTLLVIGGDLMARSRIEAAAAAASVTVQHLAPSDLGTLEEPPSADLVILDLDSGGRALIEAWAALTGPGAPRTLGYFSHVDAELGHHASAHGIEALPRGRFWRSLTDTLTGL